MDTVNVVSASTAPVMQASQSAASHPSALSTSDDDDQKKRDLSILLQPPDQWPDYEHYKPLDRSRREIRVLKIWHNDQGNEMHASIEHCSLDERPQYEALSYCWGAPAELRPIYIGTVAVFVRSTLWNFLNSLCRDKQSLPIWFDVLCINQKDIAERNSQVAMMGEIYGQAVRTISWIGEADAHSEYIFALLANSENPNFMNSVHRDQHMQRLMPSLLQMVRRPYWDRLWVVQEIILAHEVVIACGTRRLRLSHFAERLGHERNNPVVYFHEIRQNYALLAQGPTLCQAVIQFGGRSCTEPLDKIFGLRSISSDGKDFDVNYEHDLGSLLLNLVSLQPSEPGRSTQAETDTELTPKISHNPADITFGELYNAVWLLGQLSKATGLRIASILPEMRERRISLRAIANVQKTTASATETMLKQDDDPHGKILDPQTLACETSLYPRQIHVSEDTIKKRVTDATIELFVKNVNHPLAMWTFSLATSTGLMTRQVIVSFDGNEAKIVGVDVSLDLPYDDASMLWIWLLRKHEIQMCKHVSDPSIPPGKHFGPFVRLHYTQLALLIIGFESQLQPLRNFTELDELWNDHRARNPLPRDICLCKYDEAHNQAVMDDLQRNLQDRSGVEWE